MKSKITTKWKKLLGIALFAAIISGCGGSSTETTSTTPTTDEISSGETTLPTTLYLAFLANDTLKIVNSSNPSEIETIGATNDTTYLEHADYTYPNVSNLYQKYVIFISNGKIYKLNLETKSKVQISNITKAEELEETSPEINSYPGYIEVYLQNGTTTIIPTNMAATSSPPNYGNFYVLDFIYKLDTDGKPLGAIISNSTSVSYCPLISTGIDLTSCKRLFNTSNVHIIAVNPSPLKAIISTDNTDLYAFYINNETLVHLYNSTADSNSVISEWDWEYVNDNIYVKQSNSTKDMIKKIDGETGSNSTIFSSDKIDFLGTTIGIDSFAVSPTENIAISYSKIVTSGGIPQGYENTLEILHSNGTQKILESSSEFNYYIRGFYGETLGYGAFNATLNLIKAYDTTTGTWAYNGTGTVWGEILKTSFQLGGAKESGIAYVPAYNGTHLLLFSGENLKLEKTVPLSFSAEYMWGEIFGYGEKVLGVTRLTTTNSTEVFLLNTENNTVKLITDTPDIDEWPVF